MLQVAEMIELGERSIRTFFEHRMATYAAALAYRGLFGLFPFVLLLVVLAGALGLPNFFERTIEQVHSQPSQQVPQRLEPVVEQSKEQIQPLQTMIEQVQRQAGRELIFFGIAVALWSTSALARTLTDAFNAAYEVVETRPGWKRFALSTAFGPVLALMVIVSVGLLLIGPQLVERVAELVGLDEVFVSLWSWLRFPVALFLLAVVLSKRGVINTAAGTTRTTAARAPSSRPLSLSLCFQEGAVDSSVHLRAEEHHASREVEVEKQSDGCA
jgi:membrane protein